MNKSIREMQKVQTKGMKNGESIVWHGMTIEQFKKLIKNNNKLKAYTTQRFWKDGKIRKDNAKDYNTSYWYHGWSLSRSKQVSTTFGEIVFAIDLNEVKKTNKIIPISWNFTISKMKPNTINYKKEQEEFVIAHKGKHSLDWVQKQSVIYENRYDEIFDELRKENITDKEKEKLLKEKEEINDFFDTNWFKEIMQGPKGKELDITKISKGFFIIPNNVDRLDELQEIIKNPMCLGILDREEILQEHIKKETKKIKP